MSTDIAQSVDPQGFDAKHDERLERIKAVRMIDFPRGVEEFEEKRTNTEIPREYLDSEARSMVTGMAIFPYLHDKNTSDERQSAEERLMNSDCLVRNGYEPNHFNTSYTCVTPNANAEHLYELEGNMSSFREDEEAMGERKCHFYRLDMGNGEFAVKIVIPVTVRDGRISNSILLAIFPSSDQSELIWEGLRSKKMPVRGVMDAIARHIHPDLQKTLYTTDGDIPVGRVVRIPEKFVNEALKLDRTRAVKSTASHAQGFLGLFQGLLGGSVESHENH